MTSPFDDAQEVFLVLADAEGRCSLWPAFARVPDGWTVVHGPDGRAGCLRHVDAGGPDLRPTFLSA